MTISCLALGTKHDSLFIVRAKDEYHTVLCYVSTPFSTWSVRKLVALYPQYVPGTHDVQSLTIRKVKDYRRVDQAKGIEIVRINNQPGTSHQTPANNKV